VNGCVQGCPFPRAAMPSDGADHHYLRGVCQGNRCGRESAEYIDDLRNAKGILKTARECGTDTSVVQRIKAEMGQDHTSDA